LNRLDEIIIFRTLRMEEVRVIADLMLSQTSARLLEARGFSLQISGRLMSHLLESGYDEVSPSAPLSINQSQPVVSHLLYIYNRRCRI